MKYVILKSETTIEVGNKDVKILSLNDMRQTFDYDCGSKILQTVFAYHGIDVREDKLMKELGTNSKEGTAIKDMIRVAKKYGFKVRAGKMDFNRLKYYVNKEIPVMVLVQAWTNHKTITEWKSDWKDGHWVAVIGFSDGKVIFEDPSSVKRTWMNESEFMARWHDTDGDKKYNNYGMVLISSKKKADTEHMD